MRTPGDRGEGQQDVFSSVNWSLIALIGIVLLAGLLFYRVIHPFILPLLLAAVLAILFRPIHLWLTARCCGGHDRIAAGLTTIGVVTTLVVPLTATMLLAGAELVAAGQDVIRTAERQFDTDRPPEWLDDERFPRLARWVDFARTQLTGESGQRLGGFFRESLAGLTSNLYRRTRTLIGDAIQFFIAVAVIVLGLYYLLADGENLLREARRLSPLGDADSRILFENFDNVCRGVILGSVVAALVQGLLAGIGFVIVGIERFWLLALATVFFSMIPFLGAAAVWICVAIGLLVQQRYAAAAFLTLYGAIIVSGSDNLIRAYIIGDRLQMHPFIMFVTVLGALQFVGLWGILIGPLIAAFLYALVNMLHQRISGTV